MNKGSGIGKEEEAKKVFMQAHDELFAKEKEERFGFFRSTTINKDMSMEDIVKHAQSSNNRSRKVMVGLGWMDKDGQITKNAPLPIQDLDNKKEMESSNTAVNLPTPGRS